MTFDPGLADQLRSRTARLHREAEQSGIVREILRGRASLLGYALLLRNLLPAYVELERGLEASSADPAIGCFARPVLYRAPAIAADLVALAGPDWSRRLPLLPAGDHYAARVRAAADRGGHGLIGHAYTRYLGDLNGARVIQAALIRTMALPPSAQAFFEFAADEARDALARSFRSDLDQLRDPAAMATVIDAAIEAFSLNIRLSCDVQAADQAGMAVAPEPGVGRS